MDGETTARLIYLVLLGAVILTWFLAQNRNRMNKTLQQALLWLLLFSGVVVLYGLRDELRQQVLPRSSVQIDGDRIAIRRAADQHFYATLTVNGQPITFVVDTGATDVVLSREDARRIGFEPDNLVYFGTARTANGEVRTARIKLETVEFAGFTERNVAAWVNDGEMFGSLLGMAYLSRFARLEITGDTLYLTR
jgi:aspartyl protease family protein